MKKLRLRAEYTWADDPEKLKRLFAAPEEVQGSVRHKRKSPDADKGSGI
jgi:hypothetical protein